LKRIKDRVVANLFCACLGALVVILVVGCQNGTANKSAEGRSPRTSTSAPSLPEVEEFLWGNARIALGMTKEQVLKQIQASGVPQFGNQFGIRPPPGEMILKDTWQLSFGNGSGAAPGGGMLQIRFSDGKVASIRALAVFA
jgi:hypothetical protein